MPAPGEQNRATSASANPFESPVTRINEFTAQEIATLQSRLEKQLGPEYISSRPGAGGGKVHYLAAEKVINLANSVFGFNGWSSQIQNVQVDFCDESENSGKITLGLSIIVRVTLKDGTFHEDIGYGHIENCKGKAAAFEKAKKEAATDALKRALRTFGNVLGNCLYDKDYLSKVTKVKIAPSKWDVENLHRHPDFAPIKQESAGRPAKDDKSTVLRRVGSVGSVTSVGGMEFEDEFGANLFDEVELGDARPDEVVLHDRLSNMKPAPGSRSPTPATQSVCNGNGPPPQLYHQQPPQPQPQLQRPDMAPRQLPAPNLQQNNNIKQNEPKMPDASTLDSSVSRPGSMQPPTIPHQNSNSNDVSKPSNAVQKPKPSQPHPQKSTPPLHVQLPFDQGLPQAQPRPQPPSRNTHEPPVGFITGRAAELLNNKEALPSNARFNPNADSPSIRKTTGFNHTVSAPISRTVVATGTAPQAGTTPSRPTNFVNPADNSNRRIGMPGMVGGGGMSPHHPNRSAYKPPQMAGGKRLYSDTVAAGAAQVRPPLADVSNLMQGGEGDEVKRSKIAEV